MPYNKEGPTIRLSTEPLADHIETIRVKTGGSIISLAAYFGTNVRNFNRYFGLTEDGHIEAKVPAIPLHLADQLLTHAGGETLQNLWDFDELDVTYHLGPRGPKCVRCDTTLQKPRKNMTCGFCIEETTGRTLTYRAREIY